MNKTLLKKEKWTLSFNPRLKHCVIVEARKNGMYPVNLLEQLVREKFDPYGHSDINDSLSYVGQTRKKSKTKTDPAFLREIRQWQKLNS